MVSIESHTSRRRSRVGVAGSPAAAVGRSQRVASYVSRGRAAARSPHPRVSRPRRRRARGVEVESSCVYEWLLANGSKWHAVGWATLPAGLRWTYQLNLGSGYPKILGRVIRVVGNSGIENCYPIFTSKKHYPKFRVPDNSGSGFTRYTRNWQNQLFRKNSSTILKQ
jgi:hypothetical protein